MTGLARRSFLRLAVGPARPPHSAVLVCVYLRGGADGLSLVVPYADDRYHALRPTLALSRERVVDLDGRFGLHPALAPLHPAYVEGRLALVTAVGSGDQTRSHFEAQDRMEHGDAEGASGWIARHLRARAGPASSLTAVAIGTSCPESLRGAPAVSVLESIDAYGLGRDDRALARSLASLHAGRTSIDRAGRDALATLQRLERVRGRAPAAGAAYPDHPFGRALAEVARLVKARAGLEVACVDLDGWDTHFVQATAIDEPLRTLGLGLAAFEVDLGGDRDGVVVAVMTEFGRRAYENASLGTDHGRASAMLVLGGGVRGGRVLGDWPGLGESALEEPGDLRVTTDYRAVLAELLGALGNDAVGRIFPGFRPSPLGLFD